MMYAYCDEHNLPYKRCGKLIVATREEELPRLDALWDRAIANGCEGNGIHIFWMICKYWEFWYRSQKAIFKSVR